jgi:pimeloyl-[acyl-carrier protein] methyl ester esterase
MANFLIHGWAFDAAIWPQWMKGADTFCCQAEYYPEYAQIAQNLVDVWEKQRRPLTVVGWSLGGMLSLQLALDHPDKIKKLILISSTAKFTAAEDYPAGLESGIVKNLARKLSRNPQNTKNEFYQLMFSAGEQEACQQFLRQKARLFSDISLKSMQSGLAYLLKQDLRPILRSVSRPCLIIHGTEDGVCPPAAAEYLAAHIPDSKLIWVCGAGHIPFYTQPESMKKLKPWMTEELPDDE